ncbi:collectin-10, partial [Elysia marginata]
MYFQLYGDSCFHFVLTKRRTYKQASSDCRQHGGTLALSKTKDLNDFLTDQWLHHYRMTDPVWIGLHDMRDEKKFVWEDNTRMQWNNFAKGNGPGNKWWRRAEEDCVALDPLDG